MSEGEGFEYFRPLVFSIAYRMLGVVTEAEDMVQQTYLRYQAAAPGEIRSNKAFLCTVVTRLCINYLTLARSQRETYVGTWLPEPILTEDIPVIDPARQAEMYESLSIAFLALLEHLSPLERAIFLLREVFDYEYAEIAQITEKTATACRQHYSRAKKHITRNRPRFKPTPETHQHLLEQFIRATQEGDMDGLLALLAEDVVMWADGGGKVSGAITRPLHGNINVARFLLASRRLIAMPVVTELIGVNGEPAFVLRAGAERRLVMSIDIENNRVIALWVVGNPDKLKSINQNLPPTEEIT